MMVFSPQWFKEHQRKLLWFANTSFGRYILRIHGDRSDVGKNKIIKIEPHAITWKEGEEFKCEVRTHAKFSKRLYYAFRPLWHLFHFWDMAIANNLRRSLNLGFDTLTVYPNAHPETSSVDGYAARSGVNQTFANIRSGAGNQNFDGGEGGLPTIFVALAASTTTNQFQFLSRGITLFDTTSVDSSADVSAATLSMYGEEKYTGLGDTSLVVVSSNPSSNTNLADSDYSTLGSTSFGSTSSLSTSSYNDIVLNSNGIAQVSPGGISKFGQRLEWDRSGTFSGSWSSTESTYYNYWPADYTGTSRDPKLTLTYTLSLQATYSNSNPYASGKLMSKTGAGAWTDVSSGDLYFRTYSTTGATTVTYNSIDPSDILRAVIDNYNDSGGTVTYDGSSIDDTNTSVSYTFVTQTILECINKILELSPSNWYWYVDPATNLIHFHEKSGTADHSLTLGKDIQNMDVDKRTEGIVNTVYFRGGDIGAGVFLYKKYQDTNSVGTYGVKAMRYVDERVTVSATAQTIANSIISRRASPEVRLTLNISDSNISGFGYDIESINIGSVVNIQNIPGSTGRSLWNLAVWDVDKWDYNLSQIGSMYLQIVRKEYSADTLKGFCSTIPPDVSKRIEDINRNLEASQTADNPDEPQ